MHRSSEFHIRPLDYDDLPELRQFTDSEIGKNYFSHFELELLLIYSHKGNLNSSFVAMAETDIAAARLTYAPGTWLDQSTRGVTPHWWKVNPGQVGYFKSLFVKEKYQQKGLGRELSSRSLDVLKKMGAKAVLCHSWLQSPWSSSQIYLAKMGFEPVKEHLNYWAPVPYDCVVCGKGTCRCTGLEMIYYF